MTRNVIILILTVLTLFTACNNSRQPTKIENSTQEIDTTKAIKIGNYWATPKPSFEFNSLLNSSDDTLSIVTCAEFVYSPFGLLNNKTDLPTSNLKNFQIIDRVDNLDVGDIEFQILKLKSSRLILFFDNHPEASKHSYIFKGEINDSEVNFIDGIGIGMNKENFIHTFFDNFPKDVLEKYNYFVLESCVQDIKHTYSFKDNKLQSINFITDSYWTVNY